jgi:hypothetical protein
MFALYLPLNAHLRACIPRRHTTIPHPGLALAAAATSGDRCVRPAPLRAVAYSDCIAPVDSARGYAERR